MNMAFHTYVDWTTEEVPRPFYVGKGNDERTRNPERNRKHRHVRKTFGHRRDVIFSSENESDCFAKEVELIKEFHTFAGDERASEIACNFTTGGEGVSGWHPTDDTRKKISESLTGRERSAEHCANISSGKKGRASGWAGRKQSPEHIANRVAAFKASGKRKGQAPWNKGKKAT